LRHVNGVYTQRYNRLKRTDGPLFRGRYKAVLVSQDEYLLQLSHYIHRNPIETTIPMVERLEGYLWSSYPALVDLREPEGWLEREYTYQLLKQPHK
jgi:putative transposase